MNIGIIGGANQDEVRIEQLGVTLGVELVPRRLELSRARSEAVPRALLFEALAQLDLAAFVLRAVRQAPAFTGVPALLSVLPERVALVHAGSGFDDFLLHPYVHEELLGRVRAAAWRHLAPHRPCSEGVAGVMIDNIGHEVRLHGRALALTAKEFALLSYFWERPGNVLSREQLLEHVWGDGYDGGQRTVDVHVRRLRLKLGAALPIETVRGSGYKLGSRRREPEPARS